MKTSCSLDPEKVLHKICAQPDQFCDANQWKQSWDVTLSSSTNLYLTEGASVSLHQLSDDITHKLKKTKTKNALSKN